MHRIRPTLIGLALTLCTTAGAAQRPRRAVEAAGARPSAVLSWKQKRDFIDRHLDLLDSTQSIAQHPDVQLLSTRGSDWRESGLVLRESPGGTLKLVEDEWGRARLRMAGADHDVTLDELRRVDVNTRAQLDQLLARQVVLAAGHKLAAGAAPAPSLIQKSRNTITVAEAQRKAETPLQAVVRLRSWLKENKPFGRIEPSSTVAKDDADLLLIHERLRNAPSLEPTDIELNNDAKGRLVLRFHREIWAEYALGDSALSIYDRRKSSPTAAELERYIARTLLKTAGIKGKPDSKAALTRARAVVQARIESLQALNDYLKDAARHPDLARMIKVGQALMPGKPFEIATRGQLRLQLDTKAHHLLVTDGTGQLRRASFGDLAQLGMDSPRKFHRAVARAMDELIANEDLSLPRSDDAE